MMDAVIGHGRRDGCSVAMIMDGRVGSLVGQLKRGSSRLGSYGLRRMEKRFEKLEADFGLGNL